MTVEHVRREGTSRLGLLEITWLAGQASALDTAMIAQGRDVGTISVVEVDDKGRRLPQPYDVTFAFVAHAFHPNVAIIGK